MTAAKHLELLVEEPSMEAFLRGLLPRLLPQDRTFHIHPFQGKADLLGKLEARLRGYANWLPDDWRIVVVVDRDDDDCQRLKQRLEETAGKGSPVEEIQDEAVPLMERQFEALRDFFNGFDDGGFAGGFEAKQLRAVTAGADYVFQQDNGKSRFMKMVAGLSKAFALAVPRQETEAIRDHLAYFQSVRAAIRKRLADDSGPPQHGLQGPRDDQAATGGGDFARPRRTNQLCRWNGWTGCWSGRSPAESEFTWRNRCLTKTSRPFAGV